MLGLTSWTGLARLLRGEALKLSQLEYIQAAHAFGVSDARILQPPHPAERAHIVIITLVMDFSGLGAGRGGPVLRRASASTRRRPASAP
jgi:peptide/nickel transport system permease protein